MFKKRYSVDYFSVSGFIYLAKYRYWELGTWLSRLNSIQFQKKKEKKKMVRLFSIQKIFLIWFFSPRERLIPQMTFQTIKAVKDWKWKWTSLDSEKKPANPMKTAAADQKKCIFRCRNTICSVPSRPINYTDSFTRPPKTRERNTKKGILHLQYSRKSLSTYIDT